VETGGLGVAIPVLEFAHKAREGVVGSRLYKEITHGFCCYCVRQQTRWLVYLMPSDWL